MIIMIEQDIFTAPLSQAICHQVNTKGKMGRGIAKEIKDRYKDNFEEYSYLCNTYSASTLLGRIYARKESDNRIIIHLFAQFGYNKDVRQTNYEHLAVCLEKIREYALNNNIDIAIPYGMGCNNAGGNWKIVLTMIEQICYDINIFIYKKEGDKK